MPTPPPSHLGSPQQLHEVAPRVHDSGFALVIVLPLMAFVVLLLVSMAVMVGLDVRKSAIEQDQIIAKQNALFGLQMALGNLQALTGPDQRATAPGDILKTISGGDAEHPHWIGVWDSDPGLTHLNGRINPTDSYYDSAARRDPNQNTGFLGWLVSGNMTELINADTPLPAEDSVVIFGDGFDMNDPLQVRNEVWVGRVAIPAGAYAWWVGDESLKARIAGAEDPPPGIPEATSKQASFIVHQRDAIEKMDGTTFPAIVDADKQAALDRLANPEHLGLVLGDTGETLKDVRRNAHALTTTASSLLTNTYTGGLMVDLSTLLRQEPIGPALAAAGIPAYSQGGANSFVKYPSPPAGFRIPPAPTWEQLQSYAGSAADPEGSGVDVRKHTATEHGLFPNITRFILEMTPYLEADPANGDMEAFFLAPKVVLVNPYNVPLRLGNSMYVHLFFEEFSSIIQSSTVRENKGLTLRFSWLKIDYKAKRPFPEQSFQPASLTLRSPLVSPDLNRFTDSNGIRYNGFAFRLPNTTLAPGQVMSFGIANDGESYNGQNLLEKGAFDKGATGVVLLTKDASGNLVRAPLDWSNVLDDRGEKIASGLVWTHPNRVSQQWLQWNQEDPKTGEMVQSGILPFKMAIGLSDEKNPVDPDNFYSLVEGFECSNLAAHAQFSRTASQIPDYNESRKGWEPLAPRVSDLYDRSVMGNPGGAKIMFDVALGGGFQYANNEYRGPTITPPEISAHGYNLTNRWLVGNSFRAPWHPFVASDDAIRAPNMLYGGISVYERVASKTSGDPVGDLSMQADGSAFWGTGISQGDGGTSRTIFFDVPPESTGILSLGQLQHMQMSQIGSTHAYSLGSGIADMKIGDTGRIFMDSGFQTPPADSFLPIDQNFLINNALWDGYFFSGLTGPVTQANLESWSHLPINALYRVLPDATAAEINNPASTAEGLQIEGGFNINSTSVEAWKAVLAGANGLAFDPQTGTIGPPLENPLSRSAHPSGGSGSSPDEFLNGFRQLTDAELDALASAIVSEIKQRGPFLSLADFVNRRLESGNTSKGLYGTLEAALHSTTLAGLNDTRITGAPGEPLDEFDESDIPTATVRPPDHLQAIFEGSRGEGISQWISQADILQRIAPVIRPRGDTFTIRSYGEAVKPATGERTAKVLCEAVVQRTYEYVDDDANTPQVSPYSFDTANQTYEPGPLNPANRNFGRRYKIISFRWL